MGLAGEDFKRLPGRNTSVTQPTVFTKGNVGTSMVFTFWSLKHFMFSFFFLPFLLALIWFEIKSGLCWFKIKTVENQTQELKIVFVDKKKSKCHPTSVYSVNYLLNKRKCLVYDSLTHWVALTKLFLKAVTCSGQHI